MRVVVTGSEGLVGAAVVAHAQACGLTALGLPRASCELTDRGCVRASLADAEPDVVVHAAANVNAAACEENPGAAYRDNLLATQNVAFNCQMSR